MKIWWRFFLKRKISQIDSRKKKFQNFPNFFDKKKNTRTWWSHKLKFKPILYTNFLKDYFFSQIPSIRVVGTYVYPAVWFCFSLHGFQFLVWMCVMVWWCSAAAAAAEQHWVQACWSLMMTCLLLMEASRRLLSVFFLWYSIWDWEGVFSWYSIWDWDIQSSSWCTLTEVWWAPLTLNPLGSISCHLLCVLWYSIWDS